MRSKYVLLAALSMSVLAYADQPADTNAQPTFIQYNNRMVVFTPCHQMYERTQPDAFYAGVEGYWVYAANKKHNNMLLNSQLRFGYNYFWNGRDHFTYYLGAGYIENFYRHHRHTLHRPGVAYGLAGFNYDHEFNTVVNLGFTAKLYIGGAVNKKRFDWGTSVVGLDVSLPLTFRFGPKRHWDIRLEPFDIVLYGTKHSQNYLGCRSTVGYRF